MSQEGSIRDSESGFEANFIESENGGNNVKAEASASVGGVSLLDGGIVSISGIKIKSQEITSYLKPLSHDQRLERTRAAIEIGFLCLERATVHNDLDFVKGRVEDLLTNVKGAVGEIPVNLERTLSEKLGAEKGPVLSPILASVEKVKEVVYLKLNDVQQMLSDDIDPKKQSSTIGLALKTIHDLLDPTLPTSVQGSMQKAIADLEGEDGPLAKIRIMLDPEHDKSIQKTLSMSVESLSSPEGNLLKTVKSVVEQTVRPLEERVDHLALAVAGEEGAQKAEMAGVKGGTQYEQEVVKALSEWARFSGARINHVGPDNTPGDVLVTIPAPVPGQPSIRVVIEAKSDSESNAKGRVAISKIIKECVENRKAEAAVYISETQEGLRQEVNDWAEGEIGDLPWVATVHSNLITAVRFVAAMRRLALLSSGSTKQRPDVSHQVTAIRSALNHLKNVNTYCTELTNAVSSVRNETTGMREEINEALGEIERRLAES